MTMRRREFLISTSAAIGAPLILVGAELARPAHPKTGAVAADRARPDEIDALFDRSIVIDTLSVDPEWTDEVFAAFTRSGVTAIQTSLNNRNLEAATGDLAKWQTRFDRYPDRLIKVARGRDITDAKKQGKIAVVLGFQNATMIGDETSRDGIAISKRPPAFTHTMCKTVYDHPRAKSDALLKALADKGGVVGIATLGYFIGPTPETSFDDYLTHVDHAVKVAGIDHVGLASDYSIRGIEPTATRENWYLPRLKEFKPVYNVRWPPWIKELDPPERFRNIAHGLAKRGYRTGDIEKILGGNWVRYFGEVMGV